MEKESNQALKIIHVYECLHPKHGGPPEVVAHLAKEQSNQGLKISLISCDPLDDEQVNQYLLQTIGFELPRHCIQPKWIRAIGERLNLISLLKTANIVHIHGVWPVLSLVVAQLCISLNIPYLLSLHGSLRVATLQHRAWKKQLGLKLLGYGDMLKNARAWHALNQSEAEEAKAINLGKSVPIVVLGNGVNPCPYDSFALKQGFEEYFGQELQPQKYILFLSRLHPRKNPSLLLHAFVALKDKYPDYQLVFAGDSEAGCQAQLLLEAQQLTQMHGSFNDRLLWTGFVGGLKKWSLLSQAKCFVLPSLSEGFSIAVLEALSVGLPTVISTECHFDELAHQNAGLIHQLTKEDLREKLDLLLSNPALENTLRQNSQILVFTQYSWQKIVTTLITIYHQLSV